MTSILLWIQSCTLLAISLTALLTSCGSRFNAPVSRLIRCIKSSILVGAETNLIYLSSSIERSGRPLNRVIQRNDSVSTEFSEEFTYLYGATRWCSILSPPQTSKATVHKLVVERIQEFWQNIFVQHFNVHQAIHVS